MYMYIYLKYMCPFIIHSFTYYHFVYISMYHYQNTPLLSLYSVCTCTWLRAYVHVYVCILCNIYMYLFSSFSSIITSFSMYMYMSSFYLIYTCTHSILLSLHSVCTWTHSFINHHIIRNVHVHMNMYMHHYILIILIHLFIHH